MVVRVVEVPASATHDLRAKVLRDGSYDDVVLPGDDEPTTVHLAALDDDGRIVGVGSFYREDGQWKLRGMAVEPDGRGRGAGRAVLEEAYRRFEGERLWASVRDGAIGFYERMGWRIVGDGYDTPYGPHHRGEIDL